MAEVTLENVTKVYPGGILAVQGLNLKIFDQELIVLVGPSGCGKTTALRMIAGLEEVTEGTIRIGNRVVNDVPPRHRDVAMVFQNYALYPHMSVYKNMAFGLKLRYERVLLTRALLRLFRPQTYAQLQETRRTIDERVRTAARTLGIEPLLKRKPRQLSGGERQRVALGRAIVRQPAAFLLDEPLSNLDAQMRVEMRKELHQLHQRLQTTMIYVTHDQVEAMTLGHRIVVMNAGVVQQVDEPLKVYEDPQNRFVAGFIGTPPMNFLEGRLVSDNEMVLFEAPGNVRIELPKPHAQATANYIGRPVVLGVRAEAVSIPALPTQVVIHAWADVVEPLGDQMLVYLKVGTQELRSKVDAHCSVQLHQVIPVGLDRRRIHLFDPQDGRNMTFMANTPAN